MGNNNSIHEINLDNAVNYRNILPKGKINRISKMYEIMKGHFGMSNRNSNERNRGNSTRILKQNLTKFSDMLLRTNSKRPKVENSGQEKEVYTIIKMHNKERNDENLINDCLMSHFFMQYLNEQARNAIIEEMSLIQVDKNNYIFKQGAIGNYFYILKSGTAHLIIDNKLIKVLRIGESFGELALLHDAPRSGSIKAISDCLLYILERKNFRKIVEHITKINYEENLKFLESVSILSHLEQYQKTILSNNLVKEEFEEGRRIVTKGEFSSCLYIIKSGLVDCIDDNGVIIRTLKEGDNFGERSILSDTKRTLDVVAKTDCVCYSISIATLKSMLGEKYRSFLYLNFMKSAFKKSKLLNQLNTYFVEEVFQFFEAVNLGYDNVAFPIKHNKSSNIVIIIDGNLINSKTKEIMYSRGDILFEKDLINLSKEKLTYALYPAPDALFMEADTSSVLHYLQCMNFNEVLIKSEVIDSLASISFFKNLSPNKLASISTMIRLQKFKSGQKIVVEGNKTNKFFIIRVGEVDAFSEGKCIKILNPKDYFGERSLLIDDISSFTYISKSYSELYYLNKDDFLKVVEKNMKKFLLDRLKLQDNEIELEDLYYIKELGVGNYGHVSLVYCKKNSLFYAIKAIDKKQILFDNIENNLELEKNILSNLDHPLIVKLIKFLKDKKNIYLLMEYLPGLELFDVIRDIGLLSKNEAIFYGASMLLSINYLHERKLIYRDLKPENIIVIENGYIKLIDFGTAKKIEDRTSTIIGTPHYMAPEVILGEGYSFQIDFWSIAICIYEFICGEVPFGETADDPMKVYISIIKDKLSFPQFVIDHEFKLLIKQMLEKNPMKRLAKYEVIIKHLWFNGFNWDELSSLNMNPPYFPKIDSLPKITEADIEKCDIEAKKNKNEINTFMTTVDKNEKNNSSRRKMKTSKNNNINIMKYTNYINTKVWTSEKDIKFTEEELEKYNLWFDNF